MSHFFNIKGLENIDLTVSEVVVKPKPAEVAPAKPKSWMNSLKDRLFNLTPVGNKPPNDQNDLAFHQTQLETSLFKKVDKKRKTTNINSEAAPRYLEPKVLEPQKRRQQVGYIDRKACFLNVLDQYKDNYVTKVQNLINTGDPSYIFNHVECQNRPLPQYVPYVDAKRNDRRTVNQTTPKERKPRNTKTKERKTSNKKGRNNVKRTANQGGKYNGSLDNFEKLPQKKLITNAKIEIVAYRDQNNRVDDYHVEKDKAHSFTKEKVQCDPSLLPPSTTIKDITQNENLNPTIANLQPPNNFMINSEIENKFDCLDCIDYRISFPLNSTCFQNQNKLLEGSGDVATDSVKEWLKAQDNNLWTQLEIQDIPINCVSTQFIPKNTKSDIKDDSITERSVSYHNIEENSPYLKNSSTRFLKISDMNKLELDHNDRIWQNEYFCKIAEAEKPKLNRHSPQSAWHPDRSQHQVSFQTSALSAIGSFLKKMKDTFTPFYKQKVNDEEIEQEKILRYDNLDISKEPLQAKPVKFNSSPFETKAKIYKDTNYSGVNNNKIEDHKQRAIRYESCKSRDRQTETPNQNCLSNIDKYFNLKNSYSENQNPLYTSDYQKFPSQKQEPNYFLTTPEKDQYVFSSPKKRLPKGILSKDPSPLKIRVNINSPKSNSNSNDLKSVQMTPAFGNYVN